MVTRHPAERYDIRHARSWAIITLSEPGGIVSVISDYGEWGHCWPHHGQPSLKHFLASQDLHEEYLLRKFCKSRGKTHFNCEATVKQLKEAIESRRQACGERISQARLDAVGDAAEENPNSADLFANSLVSSDEGAWFYERAIDGLCVMEYDPQCQEFLRLLWPLFVEELRRELTNAKG